MMSNNIAPATVGPLQVTEFPSLQGNIVYPATDGVNQSGVFFCTDPEDFTTRTFLIYENADGTTAIQAGNLTVPINNFGIVGPVGAGQVVTVVDTNNTLLFGVTGDGQTLVNKISRSGATPTVAVNANAGTGATVVMTPGGTDSAFKLLVTAGSAALVGGTWFTVTFATPFVNVPIVVAAASDTGFNNIWQLGLVRNATTAGFDWWVNTVPGAGQLQGLSFIAIG